MNSSDAFELFSGYLEGELSAEESDALRRHFEQAPDDHAAYEEFAATVSLVRSLPRVDAPDELTNRVMHAVREARLTEHTNAPWGADDPFLPQRTEFGVDGGGDDLHDDGFAPATAPRVSRVNWQGAMAIAATLVIGFVSTWMLMSNDPGRSPVADSIIPVSAPDDAGSMMATRTAPAASGSADDLWQDLQPVGDEPLRQVGPSSNAPSIVF